ncbi:hypothetical protein [Nodosilinea sp. E11]|uniref:hypothetical protein n=1 Tax=Nodosilinea sp. E11 TaxID=3037479 RepID=UPI00293446C9|nr:hypothetical protein [Nodosilinea sp. E11]WOD41059.1 hypothetical protein RRF56_09660 [Nodosilinea sp. E11]
MQATQNTPRRWLLLGLGIPAGALAATTLGLLIFFSFGPAGGVRFTSTMEPYATQYLQTHNLLEEGEKVIAYYDATIALKGTEAAILTDRRILYHRSSATTSIPLNEIARIEHEVQNLIGDVIQIFAHSGEILVIEIAPMNGGPQFLSALEDQVARATAEPSQPRSGLTPDTVSFRE